MTDLPYMPFWAKDWVSSPTVVAMKPMVEYCYFRICIACWLAGGELPEDLPYLAALCKNPSHFATRIWPKLSAKFGSSRPGFVFNPRVAEELKKAEERHTRLSNSARLGNSVRWGKASPGDRKAIASSEPYTSRDDDSSKSSSSISRNSESSSLSFALQNDVREESSTYQEHMEYFNTHVAPKLPGKRTIREMTETRKKHLKARLQQYPNLWSLVIDEAANLGSFAWEKQFIDFDFLMRPQALQEFLEGKYRKRA